MTNYKFIGTGVTDASGVARLTKDPNGQTINGYVGSGNGEIDFVASLDNPISQGSIVSEPSSVLDCAWREDGTYTGYGKSSYVSISDGVFSNSSSSTGYASPSLTGTVTDTKKWNTDLCIEFDFTKGEGNFQMQFNDGTVNIGRYLTTDCSVRIECKSTGTFFIFNGGTPVLDSALTSNFLFRFVVWAGSSNTIQNLKIYPI